MAEESYPVVEQPVSAAQWSTMARAGGDGIIDRGNWPFWPGAVNSASNTLTVKTCRFLTQSAPQSGAQPAEATLSGFYYRMTSDTTITIPAVSSTTVYRIALQYDPLREAQPGGPIKLGVFAGALDKTQGKTYLMLWQVTRNANQTLLDAWNTGRKEFRQRVSPTITVNAAADLSTDNEALVDTTAFVRTTGETWRAAIDVSGGVTWQKTVPAPDPAVAGATSRADADTLMKRGITGAVEVETRGAGFTKDAANVQFVKDYVTSNGQSGSTGASPGLMARNDQGQTSVGAPTAGPHATPKSYVDAQVATRTPYGHGHNGGDISKTGSAVPWEVVTGSTSAYTTTSGGSTWATVAVASNGRFFRYPSALKYKKNIRPYRPSVADALAIEPIMYDAKDTGIRNYIGVPADAYVETFPQLVQYGEDGEVEGWHYQLWPVVQQVVLRDLAARLDAAEQVAETQAETIAALVKRVEALEGKG